MDYQVTYSKVSECIDKIKQNYPKSPYLRILEGIGDWEISVYLADTNIEYTIECQDKFDTLENAQKALESLCKEKKMEAHPEGPFLNPGFFHDLINE